MWNHNVTFSILDEEVKSPKSKKPRKNCQKKQLENQEWPCKFCSKTFARKDTAITHERTHASVKDAYLHCKHCGKGFAQSGNHKRHEPHCKKLPFMCTVCPYKKRFQLKQSLLRHIRNDHNGEDGDKALASLGETPYTCQKCNKNFASERGLKQHEMKGNWVLYTRMLLYLHHRNSKLDNFKDEKTSDHKTVSVAKTNYEQLWRAFF